MRQFIIRLDSTQALKSSLSGGKAANLARLITHGFNVPAGFIITPAAFRWFLRIDGNSESIREKIISSELPDRLRNEILKHYRKLGGSVAVRSSLVGEDGVTASFAGQLESILNIRDENDLLKAVKICYSSLFKADVFIYLRSRSLPSASEIGHYPLMAVIVQKMVSARAAGVAFSADPGSGRSCVIIEAVEGMGNAVVSGSINPDHYIVNEPDCQIEIKAVMTDHPVLRKDQILALSGLVRQIAFSMKNPQDVEWAWDGETFFILQARPITSLTGIQIYSCRLVSDMCPGPIKPLLWSTNIASMAHHVIGRIFIELLGPHQVEVTKIIRRIHSRVYANLTFIGGLFKRIGLPANFFEMIIRDEQAKRVRPEINFRLLRSIVFRMIPFIWKKSRISRDLKKFIEEQSAGLEFYRRADWSSADYQHLLQPLDRLLQLHRNSQWNIFLCALNMTIRKKLLYRFLKQHAPHVQPNDLIRGLSGLRGLEPNRKIHEMAIQAKKLGVETMSLLLQGDDRTIREELSQRPDGILLIEAFDDFMVQFGFLSANSTDFTRVPWIENPHLVWGSIGKSIDNPPRNSEEEIASVRETMIKHIKSKLNWLLKFHFDRLLTSTMTYIDLRDHVTLLLSEDVYQMRRIILAMADRLVRLGVLKKSEDIFFLYYDELKCLAESICDKKQGSMEEKIRIRRAELEADALLELEDTLYGDELMVSPPLLSEHQEYLAGISGSSGIAQGNAYVIHDPSQVLNPLTKEDILVVPFADVGWTPLFSTVGGIVSETGGQLSHAAIIAREYRIPAVVGVANAMRRIHMGQAVTIDGNKGRVYLKHLITSHEGG